MKQVLVLFSLVCFSFKQFYLKPIQDLKIDKFPDFFCKFDLNFLFTKECGGTFCTRFRRMVLSG